jgi:T-complex protein 1 subunit zeta
MGSTGVQRLNANADVMGSKAALFMNINAAGGLMDVMKTNLGPRGTIKMLVSGSGDIKLTKVRGCACARRARRARGRGVVCARARQ